MGKVKEGSTLSHYSSTQGWGTITGKIFLSCGAMKLTVSQNYQNHSSGTLEHSSPHQGLVTKQVPPQCAATAPDTCSRAWQESCLSWSAFYPLTKHMMSSAVVRELAVTSPGVHLGMLSSAQASTTEQV